MRVRHIHVHLHDRRAARDDAKKKYRVTISASRLRSGKKIKHTSIVMARNPEEAREEAFDLALDKEDTAILVNPVYQVQEVRDSVHDDSQDYYPVANFRNGKKFAEVMADPGERDFVVQFGEGVRYDSRNFSNRQAAIKFAKEYVGAKQ